MTFLSYWKKKKTRKTFLRLFPIHHTWEYIEKTLHWLFLSPTSYSFEKLPETFFFKHHLLCETSARTKSAFA